ncbi:MULTISPECIES: tetratricopeptide repeat protein [unclassified Colwellia]|nr:MULTISPECIES: tetratricopeptide repeat protein [unclassified Colwellia]MBA6403988.1 tetratricopeptide repeat protein [Colwellia sp. BRX10-1]
MNIEIKINKAKKLYKKNEFEKSHLICKRLLRSNPELISVLKIQALNYQGMNNLDSALLFFKKISKINYTDANAWLDIANVYFSQQKFELAIYYYEKAISFDPLKAILWNNVAACQVKLGDSVKAEVNYKKAISLDKSVSGFRINLALLFMEQAKFSDAIDLFIKTLEFDEKQTRAYLHVFHIFMYLHRYQDALEIADMAIASNALTDPELCNILVGKAILFWLFYNPEEGDQAIALSSHIYQYQYHSKTMANMVVFHRYLTELFKYRQQENNVYQCNEPESTQEMFFVSESHGFSPNNTIVNYQNASYQIRSLFIMGAKIFHLINDDDNKHKASLKVLFENLPKKSKVVVGFGEIDCRSNEGIFHHHLKTGKDISNIIDEMLNKYVQMLKTLAKDSMLEVILYGVPVPHPETMNVLGAESKNKFKFLIEYFNASMAKICLNNDIVFLDVYQLTTEQTECKLHYYIDTTHLKPDTVSELFQKLT